MTDREVGAVVESGNKRIYNDQSEYFLDSAATQCDIGNYTKVVIPSTYLNFGVICDILTYHRFLQAWFFQHILNVSAIV